MTITLTKKNGDTITFEPQFTALQAAKVVRDEVFEKGQDRVSSFAWDLAAKALSGRYPLSEGQENWLIYLAGEIGRRNEVRHEAEFVNLTTLAKGALQARPRAERFVIDAQIPLFGKASQDRRSVHVSTGLRYSEGRYIGKIDADTGLFTPSGICSEYDLKALAQAESSWQDRSLAEGVQPMRALEEDYA